MGIRAEWTQVIYGALLIVLMIVIPAGVVEALRDLYRFAGRKLGFAKTAHGHRRGRGGTDVEESRPLLNGRARSPREPPS